jgi:hypothetical protein
VSEACSTKWSATDESDGKGGARRLEDVVEQFKHWRELRVRGQHIPVALWDEAVRLCQEHAPQRVAGVLRVSLSGLTRRLERGGDRAAHEPSLDTEFQTTFGLPIPLEMVFSKNPIQINAQQDVLINLA